MGELVNRRGPRNKTFDNGDGTHTEVAAQVDLHYESELDSGAFDAEIDCSPVRVDNAQLDGWQIIQNGWHYALGQPSDKASDGWVGFGGRQGQNWLRFRLLRSGYLHWPTRAWEDIGGAPDYDRANLSQEIQSRDLYPGTSLNLGSVAEWGDIWTTPGGGSLGVRWRVSGRDLKEDVVVNQAAREWLAANSPPSTPADETWFGFVFQVDWSDIPQVFKSGIAQDVEGDWDAINVGVELQDADDRVLAFLPISHVYVGEGKERTRWTLRKRFWKDGDDYYLLVGARVDHLNALPVGDLVFDPVVNPQIAADDDDATSWTPNNCDETANDLFIGDDSADNDVGLRFTLNVAAAATITAATLTFTASANLTDDTVRTKIHYEDANDPGNFNGCTWASFQGRVRSAASIDWDFITNWATDTAYNTDDFAAVIQALVNEAYWASGEHCIMFVDDDGSDANAHRKAYAHNAAPAKAAVLNVTYTTAAALPVISVMGIHSLVMGGVTVR